MSEPINTVVNGRPAPLKFTASAWGYTKLWYVNIFLTIITLGIYGPWAKVRNNQYIYGHSSIEGHSLRYLADPKRILQGRILALGVILILWALGVMFPPAAIVLPILLFVASPWLIVQGIRFTLRNTAYRNVRFDFKGSAWDAFVHFILLPVAAAFTLYLLMPWVFRQIHLFIYRNVEFGGHKVNLETKTGTYYSAAIMTVLVSLLLFGVVFGVVGALSNGGGLKDPGFIIPLVIGFMVVGAIANAMFIATIRNHIVNNLEIDRVATFSSDLTVSGYTWLIITNTLLILVTLGLAFPATHVRKLAYLSQHTNANLQPGIDHLANTVASNTSAFGEEAAGILDTDLSII